MADRFERRLLVRVTRVGALCTTLSLLLLAGFDVLTVWMVVAVALVQGIVRSIEIPADQSLLANVVPVEDLGNAVSLTTMTQQGSRAAGPLLSGPLLATVGVEGAYAIAALFALLAFTSVARVRTSSRGGVVRMADVPRNLAQGLAYIRSSRPVMMLFLLVAAHCALTMSFDAMLPGFAKSALRSPAAGFTLVTFGTGLGALAGTFGLALLRGGPRGSFLFALGMSSAAASMVMSFNTSLAPALLTALLMGSSQAMFMALTAVLLQEAVPDEVRGRVMSLYLMAAGGIMAFANLGFGSLADGLGAPLLFFAPGVGFLLLVLFTRLSTTPLRAVYRTGTVPAG